MSLAEWDMTTPLFAVPDHVYLTVSSAIGMIFRVGT